MAVMLELRSTISPQVTADSSLLKDAIGCSTLSSYTRKSFCSRLRTGRLSLSWTVTSSKTRSTGTFKVELSCRTLVGCENTGTINTTRKAASEPNSLITLMLVLPLDTHQVQHSRHVLNRLGWK